MAIRLFSDDKDEQGNYLPASGVGTIRLFSDEQRTSYTEEEEEKKKKRAEQKLYDAETASQKAAEKEKAKQAQAEKDRLANRGFFEKA